MKKQKVEKASKDYLYYDEDICDVYYECWDCDPGCLKYEENILTNFRNIDKVKRKENRW